MNDPYPTDLAQIDEAELGFAAPDPAASTLLRAVVALERIATALENRPQAAPARPQATLTALPAVVGVDVQQRPACPYHGIEKVRPSEKGPGFYCTAKGGPQANPKGWCGWHS